MVSILKLRGKIFYSVRGEASVTGVKRGEREGGIRSRESSIGGTREEGE